jgi:hypothetical protein
MAALTAATFVLTSVSLWLATLQPADVVRLTSRESSRVAQQRVSSACAIVVVLIGLVRVAAHLFGWNVGRLDSLALLSPSPALARTTAGTMSPATALAFVLLGGALLLTQRARQPRLHQAWTASQAPVPRCD